MLLLFVAPVPCGTTSIAGCQQEASLCNLRPCSLAERNKHTFHALSAPCCNEKLFFSALLLPHLRAARWWCCKSLHVVIAVVRWRASILFLPLASSSFIGTWFALIMLLSTCLRHIAFTLSRYRHKPAQSTTTTATALVLIVVVCQLVYTKCVGCWLNGVDAAVAVLTCCAIVVVTAAHTYKICIFVCNGL